MDINKRIEFIKSDISCKDVTEMATLSDIEAVACECILRGRRPEGCNLLTVFGRVLASRGTKQDEWLKELSLRLEDAERVLKQAA
jgi:hypothetical protein